MRERERERQGRGMDVSTSRDIDVEKKAASRFVCTRTSLSLARTHTRVMYTQLRWKPFKKPAQTAFYDHDLSLSPSCGAKCQGQSYYECDSTTARIYG